MFSLLPYLTPARPGFEVGSTPPCAPTHPNTGCDKTLVTFRVFQGLFDKRSREVAPFCMHDGAR